jgi:acyl-coenzyme A thioesterase PaaI-like protein
VDARLGRPGARRDPGRVHGDRSFIRPVYPGKLYCEGSVRHRGRDIVFLEGALFTADGELVATATATARVRPFPGEMIAAPPTEEGDP